MGIVGSIMTMSLGPEALSCVMNGTDPGYDIYSVDISAFMFCLYHLCELSFTRTWDLSCVQ